MKSDFENQAGFSAGSKVVSCECWASCASQ